ncbi:hypothetical protein BB559_002478 [Furculomyces boomerangus]|uniref:ARID domain-containing protein n=1 Tax=Furculomyces boomerangus TaxID=61424 RepID=A0A2T9YV48_9FUNG|nr:hypothetical protein BB559_002478 [Furculomyces boomerangus]
MSNNIPNSSSQTFGDAYNANNVYNQNSLSASPNQINNTGIDFDQRNPKIANPITAQVSPNFLQAQFESPQKPQKTPDIQITENNIPSWIYKNPPPTTSEQSINNQNSLNINTPQNTSNNYLNNATGNNSDSNAFSEKTPSESNSNVNPQKICPLKLRKMYQMQQFLKARQNRVVSQGIPGESFNSSNTQTNKAGNSFIPNFNAALVNPASLTPEANTDFLGGSPQTEIKSSTSTNQQINTQQIDTPNPPFSINDFMNIGQKAVLSTQEDPINQSNSSLIDRNKSKSPLKPNVSNFQNQGSDIGQQQYQMNQLSGLQNFQQLRQQLYLNQLTQSQKQSLFKTLTNAESGSATQNLNTTVSAELDSTTENQEINNKSVQDGAFPTPGKQDGINIYKNLIGVNMTQQNVTSGNIQTNIAALIEQNRLNIIQSGIRGSSFPNANQSQQPMDRSFQGIGSPNPIPHNINPQIFNSLKGLQNSQSSDINLGALEEQQLSKNFEQISQTQPVNTSLNLPNDFDRVSEVSSKLSPKLESTISKKRIERSISNTILNPKKIKKENDVLPSDSGKDNEIHIKKEFSNFKSPSLGSPNLPGTSQVWTTNNAPQFAKSSNQAIHINEINKIDESSLKQKMEPSAEDQNVQEKAKTIKDDTSIYRNTSQSTYDQHIFNRLTNNTDTTHDNQPNRSESSISIHHAHHPIGPTIIEPRNPSREKSLSIADNSNTDPMKQHIEMKPSLFNIQYLTQLPIEQFNNVVISISMRLRAEQKAKFGTDMQGSQLVSLPQLDPYGIDYKTVFIAVLLQGGMDKIDTYPQQQKIQVWSAITKSLMAPNATAQLQPSFLIGLYKNWLYPLESIVRYGRNQKFQHVQLPKSGPMSAVSPLQETPSFTDESKTFQTVFGSTDNIAKNSKMDEISQNTLNNSMARPQSINLSSSSNTKTLSTSQSTHKTTTTTAHPSTIQEQFITSSGGSHNQEFPVADTTNSQKIETNSNQVKNPNQISNLSHIHLSEAEILAKREVESWVPLERVVDTVGGVDMRAAVDLRKPQVPLGVRMFEPFNMNLHSIIMSLQSGLPIEINNALNALYSFSVHQNFKVVLEKEDRLFEVLISCLERCSFEGFNTENTVKEVHATELFSYPLWCKILTEGIFDFESANEATTFQNLNLQPKDTFDSMCDYHTPTNLPEQTQSNLKGSEIQTSIIDEKNESGQNLIAKEIESDQKVQDANTKNISSLEEFYGEKSSENIHFSTDRALLILGVFRNLAFADKKNSYALVKSSYFLETMASYLTNLKKVSNVIVHDYYNSIKNREEKLSVELGDIGIHDSDQAYTKDTEKSKITPEPKTCNSKNENSFLGLPEKINNLDAKLFFDSNKTISTGRLPIWHCLIESYKSWLLILASISSNIDLSKLPSSMCTVIIELIEFFFNKDSLFPILNFCPCISSSSSSQDTDPRPNRNSKYQKTDYASIYSLSILANHNTHLFSDSAILNSKLTTSRGAEMAKDKAAQAMFIKSNGLSGLVQNHEFIGEHSCYYTALALDCLSQLLLLESNREVIASNCSESLCRLVDCITILVSGNLSNTTRVGENDENINSDEVHGLENGRNDPRSNPNTEASYAQSNHNKNQPSSQLKNPVESNIIFGFGLLGSPSLSLMWTSMGLLVLSNLFSYEESDFIKSAFFNLQPDTLINRNSIPRTPNYAIGQRQYNNFEAEQITRFPMPFVLKTDSPHYLELLNDLRSKISSDYVFVHSMLTLLLGSLNCYIYVNLTTRPENANATGAFLNMMQNNMGGYGHVPQADFWLGMGERSARILLSFRSGNEMFFHSTFESTVVEYILMQSGRLPKGFVKLLYELVSPPIL